MKHPAKNRPIGGFGKPPKIRGSAGKVMGRGKPTNGGTAYAPKPSRHSKTTKPGAAMGLKGSGGMY